MSQNKDTSLNPVHRKGAVGACHLWPLRIFSSFSYGKKQEELGGEKTGGKKYLVFLKN